ncbi:hypothetical protein HMSSN036_59010 [Paenibacillus macerans]|nr:hypothetical protein HMSSN036_59010 [Paenibacillus macerans]
MIREKIKEIAIQHFNRYGYEGTRMAQIAEETGIRKQSLSYHFSSKKELLLELYEEAVRNEIEFVRHYFKLVADYPGKVGCMPSLLSIRTAFDAPPRKLNVYVFVYHAA